MRVILPRSAPPHPLYNTGSLLSQRNPHPEPGDHLDEYECEEDAILKTVAAPRCGRVGRVVAGASSV